MGSDGRDGAAWIKARGGDMLTEAEETCVVYGMPRAVVEAGLSDEAVPLDRLIVGHHRARMNAKVLIVDDSALTRRSLRQILETAGCEVLEAEDGLDALERYYLDKPDVVLLDLVMRGMYGLDVLQKIRELDPECPHRRRLRRHPDLVAGPGRRGRRRGIHQQAVRQVRDSERPRYGAGRERDSESVRPPAGRADRADQHRLRSCRCGACPS